MTAAYPVVVFLHGALAMGCMIASVLFLSYWRDSGDRLFVFFAVAFSILGLNWSALGMLTPATEHRHWLHTLRLVAFAVIACGIFDKNWRRRS